MHIRVVTLVLALTLALTLLKAQALPLRIVAIMPANVMETSGLVATGPNHLWSHNDSGNAPEIYEFDTNGVVTRTLVLQGVANVDWEDITKDDLGQLYIGDFGNNDNTRTDLVIYKLPPPDSIAGDSVVPGEIRFTYSDQAAFPPVDSLKNFDMEAFVAFGDSLYLFSKNRTTPFNAYTKLYRLPQIPGTYVAELLDSFNAGPGPMLNDWVSGAALSPGGDHLVLVSYAHIWLFSCFQGADFFGGAAVKRTYSLRQIEASAWKDSTHLYLTDELINGAFGGNLYEADLTTLVASPDAHLGADIVFFGDTLLLAAPANPGGHYLWSDGSTSNPATITASGTYWVQVTAANGCMASDTIEVSFQTSNHSVLPGKPLIQAVPNPFESSTSLRMEFPQTGSFSWVIRDLQGRLIEGPVEVGLPSKSWEQRIGSKLPVGVFIFEANFEDLRYCLKLVKR